MEITPLTLVVLLGFGLLIAVCLAAWTALSFDDAPARDQEPANERPAVARRAGRPVSNDEVRGARMRDEGLPARAAVDGPSAAPAPSGGKQARAKVTGVGTAGASGAGLTQLSGGGSWRSVGAERASATSGGPAGAAVEQPRGSEWRDVEPNAGAGSAEPRGAQRNAVERQRTETSGAQRRRAEPAREEREEDAFERFLRERPDDFDIR
jgi:hypothetical protein